MDYRLPLLLAASPRGQRATPIQRRAERAPRIAVAVLAASLVLGVLGALGAFTFAFATKDGRRAPLLAGTARSTAGSARPRGFAGASRLPVPGAVPDPQASRSAPAPASVHHAPAVAPSYAAVAAGALSDREVRNELRAMGAAVRADRRRAASSPQDPRRIAPDGTVAPREAVPLLIARVIAGANAITNFPYVYGGGHGSFVDTAYDCSGSVSYALAAGGLLAAPETSGSLESWGAPGPGRWLTVYANAGHTYMFVDGLRYDTSGRTGVFSTRWQTGPDPGAGPSNAGFVVRHFPGL